MMTVMDYCCVNACNRIRIVKRDETDWANMYKTLAQVNYHQLDKRVTRADGTVVYNSVLLLPLEITQMPVLNISIYDTETITLYVK